MKLRVGLLAICLVVSSLAQAALPPYWESVRQISAVLQSKELGEKFGITAKVSAIHRAKAFEGFTVYAPVREKLCHVDVKVGFQPPPQPFVGPFPIVLTLGELVCEEKWGVALPPYAESVRLLRAVLDSKEVAERFGSVSFIESIEEATEFHGYTVTAHQGEKLCHVDVTVRYIPQDPPMAGPTPFELDVSELYCDEVR